MKNLIQNLATSNMFPIFAESKHYGVSVSQSAVNAHNILRAFFMPCCNLIDGCLSHIFSSSSGICNVLTNGKWQPFFLPKKTSKHYSMKKKPTSEVRILGFKFHRVNGVLTYTIATSDGQLLTNVRKEA